MMMNVTEQRIVVTAGASGIGLGIAEALMSAGARVCICDVDQSALDNFSKFYPQALAVRADVTDEADVARLFNTVEQQWGGLDALINNAGISGPTARIEDISLEEWRSVLDVNLTGVFLCTRAAVPLLKANPGGAIINLSSVSGRLGVPLRTPYAATKWGVIGITQSLAKELGPTGIRVNAILPGFVQGDRMKRVIANRAARYNISADEMTEQYLSKVSLRKFVSVSDIAAQALFLISPLGQSISGQSIGVCGNVEYL